MSRLPPIAGHCDHNLYKIYRKNGDPRLKLKQRAESCSQPATVQIDSLTEHSEYFAEKHIFKAKESIYWSRHLTGVLKVCGKKLLLNCMFKDHRKYSVKLS